MNSIVLLRGLPGSGKSTLGNLLSENGKYPVFSVDSYFTNKVTGEYNFEYDKNYLAYKECQEKTIEAIINKVEKIFIDNTFTLDWEIEVYFKLAKEYDYQIHVVTVENYHNSKNVHFINDDSIQKMASKYKVKLY
jgi:predicted kinase